MRLAVLSLFLPVLQNTAGAQILVAEVRGTAGDRFGAAVVGLGDTDSDGYPDFAVAAPARGQGAIDIFSGRTLQPIRTLTDAQSTSFGEVMFAAGDLDRDGAGDLWVRTSTELIAYSGRLGTQLWRYPSVQFTAPAGDVDGDGHADLLAGVADSGGAGVAIVLSGRTGAVVWSYAAAGLPLVAFGTAGDVDADGYDDIILTLQQQGAPPPRRIEVRSGRYNTLLATIPGDGLLRVGESVGTVGDFDRDGRDDIFVRQVSVYTTGPITLGRVTVVSVSNGATLASWDGYISCASCSPTRPLTGVFGAADFDGDGLIEPLLDYNGSARTPLRSGPLGYVPSGVVAIVGDLDRDGRHEILAGQSSLGVAQLFRVPAPGLVFNPPGQIASGETREAVAVGDVNGDGFHDLAISDSGMTRSGRVPNCEIVSGRDGSLITSFRVFSYAPIAIRAAAAGDVNRDGVADLIVGRNGPTDNYAEVWASGVTSLFQITDPDPTFAIAVAGGADWNGDQYPDLFVAAASFTDVRSGVDGAQISRILAGGDRLALVGDVDGDGRSDLAIGATIFSSASLQPIWTLGGMPTGGGDIDADGRADVWIAEAAGAVLYSGRTQTPLRTLAWPRGLRASALAAGADWDGDGVGDLALGIPTEPPAGLVLVASGSTGAELFARIGNHIGDNLGATVALLRAPNPPIGGNPSLGTTAAVGGDLTIGYGLWLARPDWASYRGGAVTSGAGCDGEFGLPRLSWLGRPALGLASALETRRLVAHASGALLLGQNEDSWGGRPLPLPLTFLGVSDCALRTAPEVVIPVMADAGGFISVPITIPNDTNLIGLRVVAQGYYADASVPGGWTLSNGLRLVVGG